MKKNFRKNKSAFTLIEVMLAVGVIAISLTALMALLGSITSSVTQIKKQDKAIAIMQMLEAQIKVVPFERIYSAVENPSVPYLVYFWEEYQNPDDLENNAVNIVSSEDKNRTQQTPPDPEEIRDRVVGDIYRAMLILNGEMLKDRFIDTDVIDTASIGYQPGGSLPAVEKYAEGYLPIRARIMCDPRGDILDQSASEEANNQRQVMEETIIKLR